MEVTFVSNVRNPYEYASSTDVMTRNLLLGLRDAGARVHFVAIADSDEVREEVARWYSVAVDKLTIIVSRLRIPREADKFHRLRRMLYGALFPRKVWRTLGDIELPLGAIIISHSPSIESVMVAEALRVGRPDTEYVQYWSDPIALSGINPEEFGFRRYPFWLVEWLVLRRAPMIVYGTRTLMRFQARMFPKVARRMASIDVCYSPGEVESPRREGADIVFGYIGGADARYRNILPLYDYFCDNGKARLRICGAISPLPVRPPTPNVELMGRVPQAEVAGVEADVDVFVCLLNHNCIQVPGKIFYQAGTRKHVIVVLDGTHSRELAAYLESFDRFILCENNQQSIGVAVERIMTGQVAPRQVAPARLAPRAVAESLLGIAGNV